MFQHVEHMIEIGSVTFKIKHFYRAMHVVLARYCCHTLSVRLSVCLSVCMSVTLMYREHIGWTSSM